MSPAHYALALYATLAEVGRLAPDALDVANSDGSTLEMIGGEHSPGFETTTGSLAQGLSVAVGVALARKRFRRPGHIWVLLSDGELEEGQTWEAVATAVSYGLDNITVMIDANGCQVDGWVKDVIGVEPIVEKLAAFGAEAVEVDGHDPVGIACAVRYGRRHSVGTAMVGNYAVRMSAPCPRALDGRPLFVVCRTTPWRGIEAIKDRHQLHYVRFRPGEVDAARASLTHGYPPGLSVGSEASTAPEIATI
jgi:transketolase